MKMQACCLKVFTVGGILAAVKIAYMLYFGCKVQPSICSVKMGLDL
jgi:hypothetical protein